MRAALPYKRREIYCELLIDGNIEKSGTYRDCMDCIINKCKFEDMNSDDAKYWRNREFTVRTVENTETSDSYGRLVSDCKNYGSYEYIEARYEDNKIILTKS